MKMVIFLFKIMESDGNLQRNECENDVDGVRECVMTDQNVGQERKMKNDACERVILLTQDMMLHLSCFHFRI